SPPQSKSSSKKAGSFTLLFCTREAFPHHEKYGIDMPLRIALGSVDGWLLFLTWLRYNYLMTHA
ncbi:MAG: hypothetical protein SO089_02005, partial [Dialister sp.]|nr:hypothetical protein [Dialister sp.]